MRHSITLVSSLVLCACGGAVSRPVDPSAVVEMEEMRFVASRGEQGLTLDAYDAGQLFDRGTTVLNAGRCTEAVEGPYARLFREFPSSRFVVLAHYNVGLCLQQAAELGAAVPHYQRVLELAPASRDGRHAAFQLTQILMALERWEDGLRAAERLLLREDLESFERLEALARRAQALLGLERLADAERQARDALAFYRTRDGDERIADPEFAAAANYVVAETLRARSESVALPPGTSDDQREALDARARLLLDAQREYFSTIRFADTRWSAAAGYRIGSMYDRLWHAMMEAPVPPPTVAMNEATRALYEREYRAELARNIRPLIRHAIRYWELTLMMAERSGAETEWTERTRSDLERTRSLMLEQSETSDDQPASPAPAPVGAVSTRGLGASELPMELRADILLPVPAGPHGAGLSASCSEMRAGAY
jgi:tetratricopeptide (TPR) repeat protein